MPPLLQRKSRKIPAQARPAIDRLQRDFLYLSRHRNELAKRHRNQYVAVSNRQVVAHGRELDAVLKKLQKQGIDPKLVIVEYLTDDERTLIL